MIIQVFLLTRTLNDYINDMSDFGLLRTFAIIVFVLAVFCIVINDLFKTELINFSKIKGILFGRKKPKRNRNNADNTQPTEQIDVDNEAEKNQAVASDDDDE